MKETTIILRFLLEIASIGIIIYWGFKLEASLWVKFAVGLVLPAILIFIWSTLAAPLAPNRLEGLARLGVELTVLLIPSIALFSMNYRNVSFVWGLIVVINALLLYFNEW